MKRIVLLLSSLILGVSTLFSQNVVIPDTAFLYALIEEGVDANEDSLISYEEAEVVTLLDVSGTYSIPGIISDLTGIEAFVNLDTLSCAMNSITSLDISSNTSLSFLWCSDNQLSSLDVSKNTGLTTLYCGGNQLTSLDVSKNTSLTTLYCVGNQLTSLDVSKNTALKELQCQGNGLTSLDVSGCSKLEYLFCGVTQQGRFNYTRNLLSSLDLSNNTNLIEVYVEKNDLTRLDFSKNTDLKHLKCSGNQLTSLDVSNNTALTNLECSDNQLTSLDVSNNIALEYLECSDNQFTSLDVSNNSALDALEIRDMPTLYEVCVWTMPFPPDDFFVNKDGSPNVYFTTECSGITELTEIGHIDLSIYPNPTNTLLTIETVISDQYSVEITSLNGQQIFIDEIEGATYQIDLSTYQKGAYFITIRSKDFVTTRKIIKM